MLNRMIALTFDDPFRAEAARTVAHHLGSQGLLDTDEVAVVTKGYDGKVRISQDVNVIPGDTRSRQAVGIVAAAISGTYPTVLLGANGSDLINRVNDHTTSRRLVTQVGGHLRAGTSVLILFVRSDLEHYKRLLERLRCLNPKLFETEWPPEFEM